MLVGFGGGALSGAGCGGGMLAIADAAGDALADIAGAVDVCAGAAVDCVAAAGALRPRNAVVTATIAMPTRIPPPIHAHACVFAGSVYAIDCPSMLLVCEPPDDGSGPGS
jgi:hypothetical protein